MRLKVLVILLLISVSACAQDSIIVLPKPLFSGYLVMGPSYPLLDFRSTNKSKYPHSYGKANPNTLSYSMVGNWYLFKNIGISAGIGNNYFLFDTANIALTYKNEYPGNFISSYSSLNYKMPVLIGGISAFFHVKNLYLEPRLMFGLGGMRTGNFDIYLYDKNYQAVKTIEYQSASGGNLYIRPSLSTFYLVKILAGIKTGIQLTGEYSFSPSSFNYFVETTDIVNHSVSSDIIKTTAFLGTFTVYGGLLIWLDFRDFIKSKKYKFL